MIRMDYKFLIPICLYFVIPCLGIDSPVSISIAKLIWSEIKMYNKIIYRVNISKSVTTRRISQNLAHILSEDEISGEPGGPGS